MNVPANEPGRGADLETTAELLTRVRAGDARALNSLIGTYAPMLERWAHGRLPASARGLSDTDDLVQITLVRVLDHVERFKARHPGAFFAYLRRSLLNNLRNEVRRASSRPQGNTPAGELTDPGPSPLEQAIGGRALHAYEAALEKLTEEQQAAVILRIELGCKHREIAEMLGSPSPNAARMLVTRALLKLVDSIDEDAIRNGA